MRILLVNVDSPFNLAIRRMYQYYVGKGHRVKMINLGFNGYPSKRNNVTIEAHKYDEVYVSNIFDINQDRVKVNNCPKVVYGGIGSKNPQLKLPDPIEKTDPYYHPHENTSYGFITRGCIRNCHFCKVPKYEGKLKEYNSVESIVKHNKVVFLDNNILAYDKHMEVFKYLKDRNIKCDFNQGLDFRLINEDNAMMLSELNYVANYIFAFDDPRYEKLLGEKMVILKKYFKKWKLKFYIYHSKDMPLDQLIRRVQWCRDNESLPYIMRDINCWNLPDPERNFITDYTSYCNQPSFFKKISFKKFLHKRHIRKGRSNRGRLLKSLDIYKRSGGQ